MSALPCSTSSYLWRQAQRSGYALTPSSWCPYLQASYVCQGRIGGGNLMIIAALGARAKRCFAVVPYEEGRRMICWSC